MLSRSFSGTSTGEQAQSRKLVEDAEWLTALLNGLMSAEPDVAGLLALIRLHRARAAARFGPHGGLVLLQDQDRSRWDHQAIADAIRLLARAHGTARPTGQYQRQAALVACHAEAGRWADTDWQQIVLLYDLLLRMAPSPVIRLHRAIALRYAGPEPAMAELDSLAAALNRYHRYHLYHATRAELLRELGRPDQARAAERRAPGTDRQPRRAGPAGPADQLNLAPGAATGSPASVPVLDGRRATRWA